MNTQVKYKMLQNGFCLVLLLLAGPLEAEVWRSDGQHSSFHFEVRAENTPVQGKFSDFAVEMALDQDQLSSAKLKVTVNIEAADMDDADINAAIAGADWFAVTDFPKAVYISEAIRRTGDGGFNSRGTLTVKGISQKVFFPFSWDESQHGARMSGEFILFRTDFDVGTGEWAGNEPISTDVRLWFDLQMLKDD
jgi:polyisoprenoid-binding protein YceI